jgi:uncharacterized protein
MTPPERRPLPLKPLSSVLVKPAGADCNLDCAYCFYADRKGVPRPGRGQDDRRQARRMSPEIQEALIRQVMTSGAPQVSFGWQGGEPTLMGLDFFRHAVDLERRFGRSGQIVGNGMQTNGLLLDDDWCDLFLEAPWLIGLSLDGPEHVHDHYRRNPAGIGTYARVRASAELMLRRGVEFNVLSVINDYSARFPREIYEHHKSIGGNFMQFIPCVEKDLADPSRAAPFSATAEAYGEFLCRVYDLWKADFKDGKPTTSVRWFDSLLFTYAGLPAPECTLMPECGVYVVIEHNGDVFACDFFVEDAWKLGNVLEGSLPEMLNSERQATFGARKCALPEQCRACEWLSPCFGGCVKDRLNDPAAKGANRFCSAFKTFFRHADADFRRMAEEWRAEQNRLQALEQRRAEQARARWAVEAAAGNRKLSRNEPCPCGSGKKFKKCCGNRT